MGILDKAIQACDAIWESDKFLYEHFKKHGNEVGTRSKKEYKNKSETLSNASPGGSISRLTTSRGKITYNKNTGEAAIYNGSKMKSYYKLRKGQIENERNNASRIEDRKEHKLGN